MTRKPLPKPPARVRQRQRADGSWRLWWEPETAVKALGFETTELDADKPTWSIRTADRLNKDVARARSSGGRATLSGGRTVEALIEAYRKSRKYQRLAAKTQTSYEGLLKVIVAKWGAEPVAQFTKPIMHTWYETLYEKSGARYAEALLRMMSTLFSQAELLGWRPEQSNPCFRLQMETPKGRARSATWAEFDALIAAANALDWPDMACAVALSTLQGARQTDVRLARIDGFFRLRGADPDGTAMAWQLIRNKRGNMGSMPLHPECAALVAAQLEAAATGQLFLLPGPDGVSPMSEDVFGKRFATIRAAAARTMPSLRTLQFRDLRRTFGVWARAGGASKGDVGDVLGNSAGVDPQLAEVYMPASFDTSARAVLSIQRPDAAAKKLG